MSLCCTSGLLAWHRLEITTDVAQWGNLATVAFLLFAPHNRQIGALVHALADGPLAAALIAWQSAWVFGSTEHSIRYSRLRHSDLHAPRYDVFC